MKKFGPKTDKASSSKTNTGDWYRGIKLAPPPIPRQFSAEELDRAVEAAFGKGAREPAERK